MLRLVKTDKLRIAFRPEEVSRVIQNMRENKLTIFFTDNRPVELTFSSSRDCDIAFDAIYIQLLE